MKVSRYMDKDVSALMGSGAAVAMIVKQINLHGGGGGTWGSITGTLSAQADLNTALGLKANTSSLAAVALSGAYADLTGRPALATVATSGLFADLGSKPTTISAYGITDAYTKVQSDANYASLTGSYANPSWITSLVWSKITSTPTTLGTYGITDATSNARSAISLTNTTGTLSTYSSGTGVLNIPKANTPGTILAQRYRHSPVYYNTST